MATIESIQQFSFTLGGYGSTNYLFELEQNQASFCSDPYDLRFAAKQMKNVSETELSEFIAILNEVGIVGWDRRYDSTTLDGIQWELKIVYNISMKKSIYGNNSYPAIKGHSDKPGKTFNKLLKAITILIQEPSFFKESC